MFSVAERLQMLRELTAHLKNVRIDTFDGLMVEYANRWRRLAFCAVSGPSAITNMNCKWL